MRAIEDYQIEGMIQREERSVHLKKLREKAERNTSDDRLTKDEALTLAIAVIRSEQPVWDMAADALVNAMIRARFGSK